MDSQVIKIGFHASHEQFAPSELVLLCEQAATSGFTAIKCSDHFRPWSNRQGQSGYAWSWLGAALARTTVPAGVISAPGYRYHPAIIAQGAATLSEMFPGRFWLALGSGEALNEAVTGEAWPEKAERNARLRECYDIVSALLGGEEVTHRGRVTVIGARLYSLASTPPPLLGAAVTVETARWLGSFAGGLLTTGGDPDTRKQVIDAFREGGGENKPIFIQEAISWATTEDEALAQAVEQWAPVSIGGEAAWDLRRPEDFERVARGVGPEQLRETVLISSDPGSYVERIAAYDELGVDEVYLHNVGRNQRQFIESFAGAVLPQFR